MPKSGRLARTRQNGLADSFSKPIIPHLVATAGTSIRLGYRATPSIVPTPKPRGLDSRSPPAGTRRYRPVTRSRPPAEVFSLAERAK